jgi:hypothetical protein
MVSATETLAKCNATISEDIKNGRFLEQLHFLELKGNKNALGHLKRHMTEEKLQLYVAVSKKRC